MDLIIRHLDTGRDELYQHHEIESLSDRFVTKRDIAFLTGNKNKVAELEEHIKTNRVKLTVLDLDLAEIQDSDALKIVQDKCKRAFQHVNSDKSECSMRSVLIEDTSLNFSSLNGMPGPYIKWFLKAVGPSGLHKMLAGFEDKSAEAVCTYALMEDETRIIFFRGRVRGRIVSPRGSFGWGWDPVFEEERSSMTFGEMEPPMKFKFSHRSNAITMLKKFLTLSAMINHSK